MVSSGRDQVGTKIAGIGEADNTKRQMDSVKLVLGELFITQALKRGCGDKMKDLIYG